MSRRHDEPRSVSLDAAASGIDDPFINATRVRTSGVELPSDRFTAAGRRTLTLEEWRRAHALAYPADDAELEGEGAA